MKKQLLGCASALAIACTATPSYSADLFVAAPVAVAPVYPWFVSVFGGALLSMDNRYKFNFVSAAGARFAYTAALDGGYIFGASIGRDFLGFVRTELEVAQSNVKFINPYQAPGFVGQNVQGGINARTLLGNVWLSHQIGPMVPYIGGGVGFGWTSGSITVSNGSGQQIRGRDSGFAYQLGGGVRVPFANRWEFDLGYRYRVITGINYASAIAGFTTERIGSKDITDHILRAGLTFKF